MTKSVEKKQKSICLNRLDETAKRIFVVLFLRYFHSVHQPTAKYKKKDERKYKERLSNGKSIISRFDPHKYCKKC